MRVEALGAGSAAGQELQQFSRWLLDIGEGKTGDRVKIPDDMLIDFEDDDAMIKDVFPDLAIGADSVDACILMPLTQEKGFKSFFCPPFFCTFPIILFTHSCQQ